MWEFNNIHAFWLFLPLALGLIYNIKNKNSFSGIKFSDLQNISKLKKTFRIKLLYLIPLTKIIALIFLVIALARPVIKKNIIRKNLQGIDILITLDISDSMLIEDMKPFNRLETAKETIKNFINRRNSDRIGLVLFSGEAYTKTPLTLDYNLILNSLKEIKINRNLKMGTAIGVALGLSTARLQDSDAKSKIIIILTDGENNSGTIDPLTALKIAKKFNIKIYTVGIGKDGETKLPIYSKNSLGQEIKRYQPFYSMVNEKLLQQLADETGGEYYRSKSSDVLNKSFDEINALEKSPIKDINYTEYEEKFYIFLLIGSIFYMISLVLNRILLTRYP